jgi:hypothetical protein
MALFTFLSGAAVSAATADLLLDDFRAATPAWGTHWDGFTDRVMGGLTNMQSTIVTTEDRPFLRLQGKVRTENNGGFLQMRLALTRDGKALDARPWAGVRLEVRGLPGPYAVHLRTPQNWFPWQFYRCALPVTADWTEVRLPFASFSGDYGAWGEVKVSELSGLAVVAIGAAFDARLDVREVGLYTD